MLDAETEYRLAVAWRDHRDKAALDRLIGAYLRLAIATASRYRRYGAGMGDLVQEASLGLMKAAEKFDPDRGVRFSTYAAFWIKASIQDYVLRNWSMVRTGSTAGQKSLFFNLARVRAGIEREDREAGLDPDADRTAARIAETLGVTRAEVAMMSGRMSGSDLSLNAVQGQEDDGREWIDLLEDDGPGTEERVGNAHDNGRLRQWLGTAFAGLSVREQRIVQERRLRDEPRTLESLGDELGLSKERVRQIEAAAYDKMRKSLVAVGGADLAGFLGRA
jgi:RNA polymerase sigma-32 factor